MADSILTPEALLDKVLDGKTVDLVREAVLAVLREVMEVEVSKLTGAGRGERSPERLTHRNGYRERRFDTRAGTLPPIPSCARVPTSPPSWNLAGAVRRHSST